MWDRCTTFVLEMEERAEIDPDSREGNRSGPPQRLGGTWKWLAE